MQSFEIKENLLAECFISRGFSDPFGSIVSLLFVLSLEKNDVYMVIVKNHMNAEKKVHKL